MAGVSILNILRLALVKLIKGGYGHWIQRSDSPSFIQVCSKSTLSKTMNQTLWPFDIHCLKNSSRHTSIISDSWGLHPSGASADCTGHRPLDPVRDAGSVGRDGAWESAFPLSNQGIQQILTWGLRYGNPWATGEMLTMPICTQTEHFGVCEFPHRVNSKNAESIQGWEMIRRH